MKKGFLKKAFALVLAASVTCSMLNLDLMTAAQNVTAVKDAQVYTLDALGYNETNAAFLTFSDAAITATGVTTGYEISDTSLTISAAGTYILSGSCSSGDILVAKDSGEVNLVLNGLTLTSTVLGTTAINMKGGSNEVTITAIDGTVNNLSDSDQGEEKPKSAVNASKDLTINGTGTINVTGNNKNGIKTDENLIIEDGITLNVTSVDHGIAADNMVTVNGGKITVNAGGDAIRSCPDVDTDGVTLLGDANILIKGGTFDLTSAGDGIQADNDLIIYDGRFDITSGGGYTTQLTASSDSCKALKAASTLTLFDGDYTINSADDAIHSDEFVYVVKGIYDIQTGDDGAHANTSLIIGEEGASNDDLVLNVINAYEGLEGGTVYMYSGDIDVVSSDDGINAAGGAGETGTGEDSFNPGGGGGFGPGGSGGFRPGESSGTTPGATTSDYSINITGGDIRVNASGDGVDSNGNITMTAGKLVVFGAQQNSDNNPLDCDGSCLVTGGLVFAAGSSAMMSHGLANGSQKYVTFTNSVASGKFINILDTEGNAVFSTEALKNVNYILYSATTMTDGTYTMSATTEALTTEGTEEDTETNPDNPTNPDAPTNPTTPTIPDDATGGTPISPVVGVTTLTFTDDAITADKEGTTYEINGTDLTITGAGNYVLSGTCKSGSITIAKDAGEVRLLLNNFNLTSTVLGTTAINAKGGSNVVTIEVMPGTTNTLSDSNQSGEKPKSAVNASKAVTIKGTGTLTVNGNNKNGIKTDTDLIIEDGVTLHVNAVDNGISADNSLTVNGGTITVNAKGAAICSSPDVNEDGTLAADGNVIINKGIFKLIAAEETLKAANNLTINHGQITAYSEKTSIECGNEFKVVAGTVFAAGVSPFDKNMADGSQVCKSFHGLTLQAGQTAKILDKNSKIIHSEVLAQNVNDIFFSVSGLVAADTYTITTGEVKEPTTPTVPSTPTTPVTPTSPTDTGKETEATATKKVKKVVWKSIKNLKSKKTKLTWKKVSGAKGYEVYRATKKKGKYVRVKVLSGAKKVTFTNSKLKKGKTYYYKVRAFVKVNGKKVYGKFSNVKSVKIKK